MTILIATLYLACTDPKDSSLEIESRDLLGIVITPDSLILPVNGQVQMQATGLNEDRETVNLTSSVDWFVEYYSILTISGDLDSEGLVTALSEGNSRIFAEYGGLKSNYSNVIVTSADLDRISITPNEVQIIEGDKVQLKASATFSNGETGDFTDQVRWITDNGSVVQFEDTGTLLAVGEGETEVYASYEALVSDPADITVDPYYEGGRPDLLITNAFSESQGETQRIQYTIKNQGTQSAIGFWVDVFNGGQAPELMDIGVDYHWFEYLGPGHESTKSFELSLPNLATYQWLIADTNNNIEESHENNNISQTSESGATHLSADLIISYFEVVEYNGKLEFMIDVTNQGEQSAEYFFVDLFVDQSSPPNITDDGQHYIALENLGPNATEYADFTVETLCDECSAWVMVDGYNLITEGNENNNISGPLLYSFD